MARQVGRRWGMTVLGVYVIAEGLMHLVNLTFSGADLIMGGLAIAAGVLLLIGK